MNVATLRVEGPDEALANIRQSLGLEVDGEWRAGDMRRSGKTHTHSGFNMTISDAATPREMEDEVRTFLATAAAKRISFTANGLTGELAIGIGVGLEAQFVAGVTFSPDDLLDFAKLGLTLDLTAYPCSEDEEAEEREEAEQRKSDT